MANNFISVHVDGQKVLLNTYWIETIKPDAYDKKSVVKFAYYAPGRTREYLVVDEDYNTLRDMIGVIHGNYTIP